jgi:hypothetical protein
VVRWADDATTVVEVIDPAAMMALAQPDGGNAALDAVADEAGQRIAAVLDSLGTADPTGPRRPR